MSTKVENERSALDTLVLIVALAILCAGVFGFYYFEDQALAWVRVLGLLAVTAVAIFVATLSAPGKALVSFMGDARAEARQVVWPTRTETIQTTLVVLVVTVLVGILLWIMDAIFSAGVSALVGGGG